MQLCFKQKYVQLCRWSCWVTQLCASSHSSSSRHSAPTVATHLVWGLSCFIDSNATLDEPLQVLPDGQNTCWAAAVFCSLQTWSQGCCHTIYVLPGMQTGACPCSDCTSNQTTPPTPFLDMQTGASSKWPDHLQFAWHAKRSCMASEAHLGSSWTAIIRQECRGVQDSPLVGVNQHCFK